MSRGMYVAVHGGTDHGHDHWSKGVVSPEEDYDMYHDMFVYKSGLRYVCAPNMSLCFTIVCVNFFSLDLVGYQASVGARTRKKCL